MSRRREIKQHLHSLQEISSIMDSMKMLALLEPRKLGRLLPAQQQVVNSVKAVAADFHHFYPPHQPLAQDSRHIYLLMGSERGFCGDVNEMELHRA
ncbi:F0F1 ATP synthase subunit gamma [Nitrosococcus wardiae]|uniref:F0F1 ATP synthase subunit gamma n=1 Tax=Nitrosococcus wardiae TaxID=1814290 RepID=A0A4V1AVW4_9GAMM|nr:F0F1 ATP synthase subunit gamma [Nitrosococcus wardiae]QBQ54545.1 hypothetical protein E3U44_08510 [Nitrosococcus wardiae]